jgi:Tol biopolymer transport system component
MDLYISFRTEDGGWTESVNMGITVNSAGQDLCPKVTPDGKYLFLLSSRNGHNNIYWMDAGIIDKLRSD